jgi:hypothetical protein
MFRISISKQVKLHDVAFADNKATNGHKTKSSIKLLFICKELPIT